MALPIQFEADWARIKLQKQETVDKSNYQVGDKVFVENPGKIRKMSQPRTGPFENH
jgi:hypothetical protein